MKSSHDNTNYQVIPPASYRCVWMLAGVLSYQLCDRQFDCDHCDLDAAMRKHFSGQHGKSQSRKREPEVRARIERKHYLYSRNHCWIQTRSDGRVRIGLEPTFVQNLPPPKAIVFPPIGDRIEQNCACLWIVLEGGTFAISSPVHGSICAINMRLIDEPHELAIHPLSKGWLYDAQVSAEDLQRAQLFKKGDIEEEYLDALRRFRRLLSGAIKGSTVDVGLTLQDGGQALRDVIDIVGHKRYVQLLREVYGNR